MKVIPACKKIILPGFLIILFALSINNASAYDAGPSYLTYQTPVDINFTFNSTLSISLSSADLLIANLAPGASASSNTITVSVDTNNITGYTLAATVGDGTTYTNDKLVNSSSNTYFDNLTSSSTLANFGNNKWGYTLDTISNSTTYSGLVYNTDTIINATTNASGTAATGYTGTSNTSFTIAAKASDTQPSGDYTNVIQFKAISNPIPSTYSIAYNSSTTDTVANIPANVAATNTTDSTVALSSNIPVRAGYTFDGWCTTQPSDTGTCFGNTYAAGSNIPITVGNTNIIMLYAIWTMTPLNPSTLNITNAIIYAPNTSDTEGDMSSLGTTTALTNASPKAGKDYTNANDVAHLIAPNFTRAGYGFAGWSTEFDATTATNPVIYGPNEIISTNPNDDRGLSVSGGAVLYPVWIASTGNLQGWSGCSSLTPASYNETTGVLIATLSSITALTDARDGNVYTVARLADGQCWMTENLRLNAEHSRGAENIAKAQGYGSSTTYGNFIGLADSEDINFSATNSLTDATNANSLYYAGTQSGTAIINIVQNYDAGYRIPRYNNNNTNMATNATNSNGATLLDSWYSYNDYASGYDDRIRWYGYGNYYNWAAAMANTAYFNSYNGASGSDAAGTSLCPTGWHLPLGGASTGALVNGANDSANRVGSFSYLDRKMGGTGVNDSTNLITSATMSTYLLKFPNNFVFSGAWNYDYTYDRGRSCSYWSSSASGSQTAYGLVFDNLDYSPGTSYYVKFVGSSVRCVAN